MSAHGDAASFGRGNRGWQLLQSEPLYPVLQEQAPVAVEQMPRGGPPHMDSDPEGIGQEV